MGTVPMEIVANICKSKNSILLGIKYSTFIFSKSIHPIWLNVYTVVGNVTDNLPTMFGDDISTKKLTFCPLISSFMVLTIRWPQNACAHRVSDQNFQKQRKIPPIPSILASSPTKNIACQRTAISCSLPDFIEKCWKAKIYKNDRGRWYSSRIFRKV